jgi:hypothetical protein
MSESLGGLRRKIDGAGELGSVVRTMKALAGSDQGLVGPFNDVLAAYAATTLAAKASKKDVWAVENEGAGWACIGARFLLEKIF